MSESTAKSQFEKMINDNNGTVDNIVLSFDGYKKGRSPSGHTCLISKIAGGNVYILDNTGMTYAKGRPTATKMSISEFESKYFNFGVPNYMAVVTNQKV